MTFCCGGALRGWYSGGGGSRGSQRMPTSIFIAIPVKLYVYGVRLSEINRCSVFSVGKKEGRK
jgi:hypothetical protein